MGGGGGLETAVRKQDDSAELVTRFRRWGEASSYSLRIRPCPRARPSTALLEAPAASPRDGAAAVRFANQPSNCEWP